MNSTNSTVNLICKLYSFQEQIGAFDSAVSPFSNLSVFVWVSLWCSAVTDWIYNASLDGFDMLLTLLTGRCVDSAPHDCIAASLAQDCVHLYKTCIHVHTAFCPRNRWIRRSKAESRLPSTTTTTSSLTWKYSCFNCFKLFASHAFEIIPWAIYLSLGIDVLSALWAVHM